MLLGYDEGFSAEPGTKRAGYFPVKIGALFFCIPSLFADAECFCKFSSWRRNFPAPASFLCVVCGVFPGEGEQNESSKSDNCWKKGDMQNQVFYLRNLFNTSEPQSLVGHGNKRNICAGHMARSGGVLHPKQLCSICK